MNPIVKAIKRTLRIEYPESTISVRLKRARNYVDTSDRLEVYVSNATYADVRTTLIHCTHDMAIYKHGGCESRNGVTNPMVWDVETKSFIDADMCEFIEVKTDGAE